MIALAKWFRGKPARPAARAPEVTVITTPDPTLGGLLGGKDEPARIEIAQRVGHTLSIDGLPDVERRAAEALARALVQDTIERVRREFAYAARNSQFLPDDIAQKIAHDVDSVACPFLMETEVFSEADWIELIKTISRGARVAVARRPSISESLALALIDLAEADVAASLIENRSYRMSTPVCDAIATRFDSEPWLLAKLASRGDLVEEIAVQLTEKVAAAARKKLLRTYQMPDFTELLSDEAETGALLRLIRETPQPRLPALVEKLSVEKKLSHHLLLMATREGLLDFLIATVSARTGVAFEQVKIDMLHGDATLVGRVLAKAGISEVMCEYFFRAIIAKRDKYEEPRKATG